MSSRIISLSLQNVGVYKYYKFEFPKGKNDLNGIIADNAKGKTTLIKSFNWLLYGGTSIDSIKSEQAENKETFVEMKIETDEGTYVLRRSDITGTHVSFKDVNGHQDNTRTDFNREVSKMLPEAVREFFLFNGEFLSNLFERYHTGNLGGTILNISKLDKWTLILNSLDKARDIQFKYNQYENKTDKKKADLADELKNLKDILDSKRIKLAKIDEDIKKTEGELLTAQKNLEESAHGDKDAASKLEEKNRLKAENEILTNKINLLRNNAQQLFLEEISDGLLIKSYLNFKKEIKRQEDLGNIPPVHNLDRIKDSIKEGKCCVCNHVLTKEELKGVEKLKDKVAKADERAPLYNLSKEKTSFMENLKRKIANFKGIMNELHKLEKDRSEIIEKLKVKESELDKVDENQFQINLRIYRSCNDKLTSLKLDNESEIRECQDAGLIYDNKMRDYHKLPDTSEAGLLSSFALEEIDKLKKLFKEGEAYSLAILAKELSDKATERYRKIFTNSLKYTIEMDTNFNFRVIADSTGIDRLSSNKLSGGEYKTAALSFILALSDVGGFDFPLIIDAPFTALGPALKNTFLEMISILAQHKQIIFFTLPEDNETMKLKIQKECSNLWELKDNGTPEKQK